MNKLDARRDLMLVISGWLAAVLFFLLCIGMGGALASGIKDSEVLVVSIYSAGCFVAFVGSVLLLSHSFRWAILVCIGAVVAAVGCYIFEADLRTDETKGIALVLIGLPMFAALLVGGGYLKAVARRRGHELPPAQLRD